MARATFSTIDRLSLRSSMNIGVDDAIADLTIQNLADAIDAVILGAAVKATVTTENEVDAGSAVPPASALANRGDKWLFRAQDSTTGKIYTHEMGVADFSQISSPTDDYLDLTAGVGAALKTAFDAAYQSPDGNAGVLLSVQQVTRTD